MHPLHMHIHIEKESKRLPVVKNIGASRWVGVRGLRGVVWAGLVCGLAVGDLCLIRRWLVGCGAAADLWLTRRWLVGIPLATLLNPCIPIGKLEYSGILLQFEEGVNKKHKKNAPRKGRFHFRK